MSIKPVPGPIRIVEEIDDDKFFIFKQGPTQYFALSVVIDDVRTGYISFFLPSNIQKTFKSGNYNDYELRTLIHDSIEEFYFVGFAEEKYNSQLIEFAGDFPKEQVIQFYEQDRIGK